MSCRCPQTTVSLTDLHRVRVRYGGGRPVVIRGPVTKHEYHFSGLERLQSVDARDAIAIIRNPLFQVEAVIKLAGTEALRARGDANA